MSNILTLTTQTDDHGLVSYSLDGSINEKYESFDGFKTDTFAVGEFSFKQESIEKSAQWYVDNFDNVSINRISINA